MLTKYRVSIEKTLSDRFGDFEQWNTSWEIFKETIFVKRFVMYYRLVEIF